MSSQSKPETAETRFRQAFERLKADKPTTLPPGTPVSQNNVAREAGRDPTALKKARFPKLVAEIQAFVELHQPDEQPAARRAARQKAAKRTLQEQHDDAVLQRDVAQSLLLSANRRILELAEEVQSLTRKLAHYEPPPINFGRR